MVSGFRYIKVEPIGGQWKPEHRMYDLQNGCYSVRQRKIGVIALNAPPLPPTPLVIFFCVYIWKFRLHNIPIPNCSQHTMLQQIFHSLRSDTTKKHRVCLMEHQNYLQTPKILPRRDCTPVLKFLDPPL